MIRKNKDESLFFLVFTANASISDAWADEKSYPAKEDYATE